MFEALNFRIAETLFHVSIVVRFPCGSDGGFVKQPRRELHIYGDVVGGRQSGV